MRKVLGRIGLAAALVVVPAVALAGAGVHAWRGHQPPQSEAEVHERLDAVAEKAMDRVEATPDQRAGITSTLDDLAGRLWAFHQAHAERHAAVRAVLTADTVDRKELEKIRKEAVSDIDDISADVVDAVADIAEILTPDQRRDLAEMADELHGDPQE